MNVELSPAQLVAISALARRELPEALPWIDDTVELGERKLLVTMPAIGWRRLLAFATNETVGANGGNVRVSMPLVRARNKIARRLAHVEAHPALRHVGLPGEHFVALPAWPDVDRWSLYPVAPSEMIVLMPHHSSCAAGRITAWVAEPAIDMPGSLADSRSHEAFV